MLYDAYQARQDLLSPLRIFADLTAAAFREPMGGPWANLLARSIGGGAELISRLRLTHEHPAYNIGAVVAAGCEVEISEEPALKTPFGTLLHFRKSVSLKQPRVLLVAP
ncbi:MAG TPA: hypothetical protein VGM36_03400, partial [Rhizomicrobium sp.]